MRKKVVTLFGGSSESADPAYAEAAREFGRLAARTGWTLRTGAGSGRSVMGLATDGALEAGGRVEGVILAKFWGVRHRMLHRLRAEPTFSRRKAGLLRGAHAVVVFPGGVGTLDEFGDVLALKQNGFYDVPLILVNVRGFFDPLLAWIRESVRSGFMKAGDFRLFSVAATPASAIRMLNRR